MTEEDKKDLREAQTVVRARAAQFREKVRSYHAEGMSDIAISELLGCFKDKVRKARVLMKLPSNNWRNRE